MKPLNALLAIGGKRSKFIAHRSTYRTLLVLGYLQWTKRRMQRATGLDRWIYIYLPPPAPLHLRVPSAHVHASADALIVPARDQTVV
jgi:hypothetical protein